MQGPRKNIEVGYVDEVVGRLSVSFGFNLKGYIVTRNGFASGAIKTAKNRGIGLIKLMPDGKVNFIMYLMTPAVMESLRREFPKRAARTLTDPNFESNGENFYGTDDGYVFGSLQEMLGYFANSHDNA